ncbi:MAG: hypothetical protein AAF628_17520 [Planctomycetota bacterium]
MNATLPVIAGALLASSLLSPGQDPDVPPPNPRLVRLEREVEAQPDDARLWYRLGRAYFFAARRGDDDAAGKAVAAFEKVRELAPERDVSYHLGTAYMTQLAVLTSNGTSPERQRALVERARTEFEAGLELRPDDAKLISGLGMATALRAFVTRQFQQLGPGIELLDRGVSVAPDEVHPRLARAFTLQGLPPRMGQTDKVAEDLGFLIDHAEDRENAQAAGVLHVFLGDLLSGAEQPAQARPHYETAAELASTAASEARARLDALRGGAVDAASIRAFRGTALRCASCHGRNDGE